MDWIDVAPLLSGYAHMATVRPDGQPHVAKVAPAVEGDVVWVATRASSRKAQNVMTIPKAALMWEPAAEVYMSADVDVVTDLADKQRLWNSGLFPYPMEAFWGAPDKPDWLLLRLRPQHATVMMEGESGLRRETWRA